MSVLPLPPKPGSLCLRCGGVGEVSTAAGITVCSSCGGTGIYKPSIKKPMDPSVASAALEAAVSAVNQGLSQ